MDSAKAPEELSEASEGVLSSVPEWNERNKGLTIVPFKVGVLVKQAK